MGRHLLWALGLGWGVVLSAAPAAAQVDIGVWTRNGGGRVVVGTPRVYYPAPVYVYRQRPIYVVGRDYYYRPYRGRPAFARGHGHNHSRFARPYYGSPRYSQRIYRPGAYARPYSRRGRF